MPINTKSPSGVTLRGLYSKISLLNHSCFPNISLRSDKNHVLFIRTTVHVKKGEPLYFSYVPTTDPVWCRQNDLKEIYYFTCNCIRCSSQSEMNTYYSSLLCNECSKGLFTFHQNISIWKCNQCSKEAKLKEIMKQSNDLIQWVNNKKISPKHVKLFLKNVAEKCPKYNFLYFETLQLILAFLKDNNSIESNDTKKEVWEDIIKILSIVEPGVTRRRAAYARKGLLCDNIKHYTTSIKKTRSTFKT
ncbi:Protein msta, isoform A [Armadillidium vulgare]|nr:Protein msta, isoform A [Armadillidium vulgare]